MGGSRTGVPGLVVIGEESRLSGRRFGSLYLFASWIEQNYYSILNLSCLITNQMHTIQVTHISKTH